MNWVCHRFPVLPALTNLDISGNRLTGGLEVIYKSSRCPDFAQKFSPNWTSRPLFHTVHCNTSWLLYLEGHSFWNWFRNPGKFVKTKLSGFSQASFKLASIKCLLHFVSCGFWHHNPHTKKWWSQICKQDKTLQFPDQNKNQVFSRSLFSLCIHGV